MGKTIDIGGRKIGNGHPVFIVAELSANHNQDYDVAVKTIKAAKKAGADAVKLQTYTADTITLDADTEPFQIKGGTLWDGMTLHELYNQAHTPWDWQPRLKKVAEQEGMICFSAAFDKTAIDFLEKMDMPAHKLGSPEITDIPLIERMAETGKPLFISTGVAELADIKQALNACERAGNKDVILLKCTAAYPTPLEDVNLKVLPDMERRFGTVVGISDHTLGIEVPIAAVALGAKVVEKHLILDKSIGGPDADFSIDLKGFEEMVKSIRKTEKALGMVTYDLTEKMANSRKNARSLFIALDVKKGDIVTEENVRSVRPGQGLPPAELPKILGKQFLKDCRKGTPLSWELLEEGE